MWYKLCHKHIQMMNMVKEHLNRFLALVLCFTFYTHAPEILAHAASAAHGIGVVLQEHIINLVLHIMESSSDLQPLMYAPLLGQNKFPVQSYPKQKLSLIYLLGGEQQFYNITFLYWDSRCPIPLASWPFCAGIVGNQLFLLEVDASIWVAISTCIIPVAAVCAEQ